MAYKKYIRKNGKLYGPYIYSSKRVDGKVVSEYHGAKENKDFGKNFLWSFLAIIAVGILIAIFLMNPRSTGLVVGNLDGQYINDSFQGNLKLSLNSGEFLPADSKVVIDNEGEIYEYSLKEISNEELSKGDYYVKDVKISGSGEGYGQIGEKFIYPDVYFELRFVEKSSDGGSSFTDINNSEEIVQEENISSEEITTEENVSQEIVQEETVAEETPQENIEIQEDNNAETEIAEIQEENPPEEIVVEPIQEETSTEENSGSAPITGNAISGFFSIFRVNGRVISEGEETVQGDVSYGKEFKINIPQGFDVEIVPGSVRTETEDLSEKDISLEINSGEAIVTTDYYLSEEGFGEEYLGEGVKEINLKLPEEKFKEGTLKVNIGYNGSNIFTIESKISKDSVINETEGEFFEENETSFNFTNETIFLNDSFEPQFVELSEKEIKILKDNFENKSIEQTAKEYKEWIIITFSVGDYSVEYSYDKDLDEKTLDYLIEKDKNNWLKDLAASLSYEKTDSRNLDNYSNRYEL
ncbi:MAG: hypothetical protein KC516_04720 [Nanoarchaeota archaeon]|nr:hypothetical protein [Nanoarchaeota archaeon]